MTGRQIWEVSSVEAEKGGEENGTELSLDLSIGGGFKKLKNPEYAIVDRDVLEGQRLRIRVRGREMREKEANITGESEDLNLALSYNPARYRSFRPSYQQDQNSVSDDPSLCISSDDSDNRSCSHQGGCSSDNGSYSSSDLKLELPELRNTNNQCPTDRAVPPSIIGPVPSGLSLHKNPMTWFDPAYKPTVSQRKNRGQSEISSTRELGKPPKPRSDKPSPFSHMPCVSTTGDGPDGKTVTGFLYKYTKADVKIICVCHGSSFTPAEFVEHAGGRGFVPHPLRHITVVPSVF